MAILVLFKQFSTLILRASPHTMDFVRSFSTMLAHKGVGLIAIEVVRYYGKVAYIKNILKMTRGWMHTPHLTPLDPPLANGHKLQKPSKESGIYQSFGPTSFVVFLLKGRVKTQKGERRHNAPLLKYAPA